MTRARPADPGQVPLRPWRLPRRAARRAVTGSGQSRMLIMDVCGAYMRSLGGWFAISKIVQLMGELDVDEAATRSALLRMRRKELLEPAEPARNPRPATDRQGAQRAGQHGPTDFRPPDTRALSDGWVLVAFSVPEEERANRHLLRSRLSWLGFGNLSNGLWMAPHRMHRDLEAAVMRSGLRALCHDLRSPVLRFRRALLAGPARPGTSTSSASSTRGSSGCAAHIAALGRRPAPGRATGLHRLHANPLPMAQVPLPGPGTAGRPAADRLGRPQGREACSSNYGRDSREARSIM